MYRNRRPAQSRRPVKRWTLPACAAAMMLIGVRTASAQAIDYGSLEALFGEAVTTSVTGSPQRASDVPASMIIVTQDDIRRSGARDIPGVLSHIPGLSVLQWTNDDADVAVRGYNQAYSPRILVLVNGRQVYADDYGYTPWSTLPVELSAIRQIEIVMGPNSALFGFNAVGGVINIVTYDPLYDDVNTGSVTAGTQELIQGSGIATFKFGDDAGLSISLGGRRNDDFSTAQRPLDIGTRRGDDRKAIDILGHARLGGDIDASLAISHSEVRQPEITPVATMFYVRYRTSSIKATLSAETGLGLFQATAYGNWLRQVSMAPDPVAPTYHIDNRVYVVQLRDIFKLGNDHIFRLSAEYRHNDMETAPLGGSHVFYNVLSGGAMWNWTATHDLSLTNAVRVDHLSLGRTGPVPPGFGLTNADWDHSSLTAISFNSGAVWSPDSDNTFRFTVARGMQLPNLLDFGGLLLQIPGLGFVAGIPTLKSTVVMNYEADWDRKLPEWNAQLQIRAFHQTSRGITADGGGVVPALGLISVPADIGRSQASGLELALNGTFSEDWRWGLSYTPEIITDRFAPGFNVATVLIDYEHTNPVHVVKANLGWARGPWEIDGYLRHQSRTGSVQGQSATAFNGILVRIPDYVSIDARAAYNITDNFTIALSGQNLLQSPQKQTSAPNVERRVYITATASF
jgi:iron complex outermembrane recepter protein